MEPCCALKWAKPFFTLLWMCAGMWYVVCGIWYVGMWANSFYTLYIVVLVCGGVLVVDTQCWIRLGWRLQTFATTFYLSNEQTYKLTKFISLDYTIANFEI